MTDGMCVSKLRKRINGNKGLTEHLKGLPHWLFIQYMSAWVIILTILDTLHVLDGDRISDWGLRHVQGEGIKG